MSDGHSTYQEALDWASENTMEDLHVMRDKKGVFHLFRHGEEEHYRKTRWCP
jgi:hypothetical protein